MNVKEQLKETSQQLQSLMSSVPGGIGIFEWKENTLGYRYFNDGLSVMLGYTHEEYSELIRKSVVARVYQEDLPVLMKTIEDITSNPQPNDSTTCEIRMMNKNDSLLWVFLSASIMSIEPGCIVFSAVFMDVTDLKNAQEQLEQKNAELRFHSEHDYLTGLYNREKFCNTVEQLLKENPDEEYAILRFDIERFKMINELFGSEVGDRVLCCIADMIREEASDDDIYCRLEADHFALCMKKSEMDVERMLAAHQACVHSLDLDCKVNICAGIIFTKGYTMSAEQMCERANMALGTVKGKPFEHYAVYRETMRHDLVQEQFMVNEMQAALDGGQFVFYLQPIYDAGTEQPVSAEALVRWIHPIKGMISPGAFIPLFEQNGFITKVDYYIWNQVCLYLSTAVSQGEYVVPVSVNVSRTDLFIPDLCERIIQMVDNYKLDHSLIKFEITESAYMDDSRQLQEVIETLQNNGFKVLMDDFGSGYSSLNMLKDTPIDILKIDMRFLEGFSAYNRSGNILNSVVRMAKLLDMNVVAEGVETREQLSFLKGTGCDWIQGYFFSKPLPLDAYRHMLQSVQLELQSDANVGSKPNSILASEIGPETFTQTYKPHQFTWESMQRELDRQRHYFDVVRVVDPVKTSVCGIEQGSCNAHACHAIWQKDTRCGNCISMKALENCSRLNKLEYSNEGLFFVIAQYIQVEGQALVMELVTHLDDGYVDNVFDRDLLFMKLDDLERQVMIDELTGVYNRRYLDRHLPIYLENGNIMKYDVGVAMVDIDYLKEINDNFGHQAGDDAIRQIAILLKENIAVSKGDFVARYGGDEFIVVCRNIVPQIFHKRLQEVSVLIHKTPLNSHPEIRLGASIGAVNLSEHPKESMHQMIDYADQRLYDAKSNGRGAVSTFPSFL